MNLGLVKLLETGIYKYDSFQECILTIFGEPPRNLTLSEYQDFIANCRIYRNNHAVMNPLRRAGLSPTLVQLSIRRNLFSTSSSLVYFTDDDVMLYELK